MAAGFFTVIAPVVVAFVRLSIICVWRGFEPANSLRWWHFGDRVVDQACLIGKCSRRRIVVVMARARFRMIVMIRVVGVVLTLWSGIAVVVRVARGPLC